MRAPCHDSGLRGSRGGRRSTRAQAPVLHPVAAHSHVAPGSPARMRAVVVGPTAVRVPTGLEPRPRAVPLRVAHDHQEGGEGCERRPLRPARRREPSSRTTTRSAAASASARSGTRAADATGSPDPLLTNRARMHSRTSRARAKVDLGPVGQADLSQPVRALDGVVEEVDVRVAFPGVHERLEDQKRHGSRLRLFVGDPVRKRHPYIVATVVTGKGS